jgi:hypothetical protein
MEDATKKNNITNKGYLYNINERISNYLRPKGRFDIGAVYGAIHTLHP